MVFVLCCCLFIFLNFGFVLFHFLRDRAIIRHWQGGEKDLRGVDGGERI